MGMCVPNFKAIYSIVIETFHPRMSKNTNVNMVAQEEKSKNHQIRIQQDSWLKLEILKLMQTFLT